MHPKNPFIEDYNFEKLGQAYPPLNEFVFVNAYATKTINFGNQEAVRALNIALLKFQYGIIWDIPDDYLCPPIPGRLDYLLHVADLIGKDHARLLDIGTGANLIYPILATTHLKWSCVGTEYDEAAFKHAGTIISKNPTLKEVEIRRQPYKEDVLNHIIEANDFFDAVVCNPPFHNNAIEAHRQNQRKVKNLQLKEKKNLNFGGQSNELLFKGGEVGFIKIMALESFHFKDQVRWFTSLVSKNENIKILRKEIEKIKPKVLKVVDMKLGNKQARFVAWSFFK